MRLIQIEDALRLRFPGRSDDFDDGVEIGLLVAQLAGGERQFTRTLHAGAVEQARTVAGQLGYRATILRADGETTEMIFMVRARRPHLRLVHDEAKFG